MNKKILGIFIVTLLIGTVIPTMGGIVEEATCEEKLDAIREAIKENDANWTAGYTSVFGPDSDRIYKGGCLKEDIDESTYEPINYEGILPSEFDWRNVDGVDWMTSVKDQSPCGSCVAFGTLGALEAVVQIEVGYPFGCDLSEAHLFFCGGGNCNSGWYTSEAADFVKKTGVTDEACFPYKPYDMPCNDKASNWKSRVVKVTSRGPAMREQAIKKAIVKYGPVSTAFDVYEDFRSYRRGIYEYVWGERVGGHCVSIVGYNDNPGYWICKNSWDKNWGEKGYFRIKYRECGIDDTAYYFDAPFDVNLSWDECVDPDGGSVHYDVYLKKGTKINDVDILVDHTTIPYFYVQDLVKSAAYSWKVVAEDEGGSQSVGEWKFTTRPPSRPVVDGPAQGSINKELTYTATGDTDGDLYMWFFDWGDDSNTGWILSTGPMGKASHTWTEQGDYTIRVKYQEDYKESDWRALPVSIPKNKPYTNTPFLSFLENHLHMFPLLRQLLRLQ